MAKKQKTPLGIVFWVVLLSLVVLLYVANRINFSRFIGNFGISEIVKNNFGGDYRIMPREKPERTPEALPSPPAETPPKPEPGPAEPAPAKKSPTPAPSPVPTSPTPQTTSVPEPVKTREARLYFIKLSDDGRITLFPVKRKIDARSGPMADTLQALLQGPNREESGKGIVSLIPEGSKLLSASVKDGIAYLSFNESFRFNSYGREGYQGQMQQIVFSTTEFPTITAVQVLIEGNLVQYLSPEGFFIGEPLGRNAF